MFYFVVVVVKMNRCSFVIECFTPVLSVLCLIAKETEQGVTITLFIFTFLSMYAIN